MFTIIGWLLIITGLLAIFSGVVGLVRLPDFYSKLHASSVIDSLGIPLSLIGLACLQTSFSSIFKLIFFAVLLLLLAPVASHTLGKAGLIDKNNIS